MVASWGTPTQSPPAENRAETSQPLAGQLQSTVAPTGGEATSATAELYGDVARPPRTGEAASTSRTLPADLDPTREMALRAFWALLEEIGYETW